MLSLDILQNSCQLENSKRFKLILPRSCLEQKNIRKSIAIKHSTYQSIEVLTLIRDLISKITQSTKLVNGLFSKVQRLISVSLTDFHGWTKLTRNQVVGIKKFLSSKFISVHPTALKVKLILHHTNQVIGLIMHQKKKSIYFHSLLSRLQT